MNEHAFGAIQTEDGDLVALERMAMLHNYHRWIYRVVQKHIGYSVLDAGCGIGNFAVQMQHPKRTLFLLDRCSEHLRIARERIAECQGLTLQAVDLDIFHAGDIEWKCDTIVCLDVLEHLENDRQVLSEFYKFADRNAHLILKVPAGPTLFCDIDRATGHYRRYSQASLGRLVALSGWTLRSIRYMNMAGYCAYWLKAKLLKHSIHFSRSFPKWQLPIINAAMPVLALCEGCIVVPFGLSIVAVASKG